MYPFLASESDLFEEGSCSFFLKFKGALPLRKKVLWLAFYFRSLTCFHLTDQEKKVGDRKAPDGDLLATRGMGTLLRRVLKTDAGKKGESRARVIVSETTIRAGRGDFREDPAAR